MPPELFVCAVVLVPTLTGMLAHWLWFKVQIVKELAPFTSPTSVKVFPKIAVAKIPGLVLLEIIYEDPAEPYMFIGNI